MKNYDNILGKKFYCNNGFCQNEFIVDEECIEGGDPFCPECGNYDVSEIDNSKPM